MKDINGWEGLYAVTEDGNIWSYRRRQFVKFNKDKNGYLIFRPALKGKYQYLKVHRIVAQEFIPNHENKPQVNHIDGDKENNCVSNLEWCTNQENHTHARSTGLINQHGINSVRAKLTDDKVREIRCLIPNHTLQELADRFGVCIQTISNINHGKRYRNVA